jgi:hypothetical protein
MGKEATPMTIPSLHQTIAIKFTIINDRKIILNTYYWSTFNTCHFAVKASSTKHYDYR